MRQAGWRLYLIPVGLYLASVGAARLLGFRTTIPWVLVQLLDREALTREPLGSLLLLHSQPPGLNALLAGILRLSAWTGASPEAVAAVLFFGLGLVAALLLFRLVVALTGSPAVAAATCAVGLFDPGFHVYRTAFFYPFPLYLLVLVLLAFAWKAFAGGRERHLLGVVLALVALAWTAALYHPLWCAAVFALVAAGASREAGASGTPGTAGRTGRRGPRSRSRRFWMRPAAVGALLLAAWPAKNWWVFGEPLVSSWAGYNLARATPVVHPGLLRYLETGEVAAELASRWAERPPRLGEAAAVLTSPTKLGPPGGVRNWNHWVFLVTHRELGRAALAWRLAHPGQWAAQTFAHYWMWARPTYVDSYWGWPRGPATPAYRRYALGHQRLLFGDLRPLLEPLAPGLAIHGRAVVWGGPVPYTLFGMLGLPVLLGAVAVLLLRRRGRWSPAEWLAATAAASLLWSLFVPCLTDGTEGNRIRFATSCCVLLLAAYVVGVALRSREEAVDSPGGVRRRADRTDLPP